MNKNLIAAAVAAGLAMPGLAMADATIYGKINTGIVSYDNDTPDDSGIAIFDEASRLGFKGEEDLGNGLKAIFKMEGTVDMDEGANFNFNRDKYVGPRVVGVMSSLVTSTPLTKTPLANTICLLTAGVISPVVVLMAR
jgi:predicted porin